MNGLPTNHNRLKKNVHSFFFEMQQITICVVACCGALHSTVQCIGVTFTLHMEEKHCCKGAL